MTKMSRWKKVLWILLGIGLGLLSYCYSDYNRQNRNDVGRNEKHTEAPEGREGDRLRGQPETQS